MNTKFAVSRNGEILSVEVTLEAASREIKRQQDLDRQMFENGWTTAKPEEIQYTILPRKPNPSPGRWSNPAERIVMTRRAADNGNEK